MLLSLKATGPLRDTSEGPYWLTVKPQTLCPFKSWSGRLHLIHRDMRPHTHTHTNPAASLPSVDLSGQLRLNQKNTAVEQQQAQMPQRSTFVCVEQESVRICVFLSVWNVSFSYYPSIFFTHTHTHTRANGNLIQCYCCPAQGHLPTRPVSLTGR